MQTRIFSVPNQLTLIRMGFLPFVIIAIHYDRYDWALGILIAAGLSDGLDGLLARVLDGCPGAAEQLQQQSPADAQTAHNKQPQGVEAS